MDPNQLFRIGFDYGSKHIGSVINGKDKNMGYGCEGWTKWYVRKGEYKQGSETH
eukprot:CAMPEP_0114576654 /NCGR_PEP_ID=MMETSP0125-20121206/1390_1 /TAXON_ID=485358 ORGANISM="Aristerostoma sp., Strain ATCC 50986" /NCGR_SAMPLE_ID=MMETSP0125 /ASSEMBLY_ACC=CAM_ASM_000245 /LENGTH=53 /DNA_ID=CAMNT_0001765333 /DNA_START=40 /DNA_END=201 /DNA_ORIENTATION=+